MSLDRLDGLTNEAFHAWHGVHFDITMQRMCGFKDPDALLAIADRCDVVAKAHPELDRKFGGSGPTALGRNLRDRVDQM